ncbi:MAG: L-histidine N(alpha)-methyltransferase [Rhodoferax sp.]|nr:L-histidine N(alpha)-methyltransferase [Rhodoferax sp.]MDP3650863.1 L-histidine N(alpha)-methyltransferase [Rhodoferax sp.]
MKQPIFIQLHRPNETGVRAELLRGLSRASAHTSPKYLYDALGSRLFEAITELPEYYPTRTEAAIFARHGDAMATHAPRHATLVDLGAGNCAKASRLFGHLAPSRYVAVDISVDFLRSALDNLQRHHPALDMVGVGADFSAGLVLPSEAGNPQTDARVLFYPGSSIGNFAPDEALVFLRSVRATCGLHPDSGLLIGVDLVKATVELEAAYDDALGVTAAFNRNLLLHINRLCGTNFALPDWRHVALFNVAESRIEMHLEATRAVTVRWADGTRRFAQGERIHTENSYKWTLESFSALLRQAGFQNSTHWTDPEQRFAVFWTGSHG